MIRDFVKEISEKSALPITKFLQSKMLELTEEEIKFLDEIRVKKRRMANERRKSIQALGITFNTTKDKVEKDLLKDRREAMIKEIKASRPQNEYEAMRNKYLIEYLKNNDITNIDEAEGIMIREDDDVIEVFISDCDDELVTDGTRLG